MPAAAAAAAPPPPLGWAEFPGQRAAKQGCGGGDGIAAAAAASENMPQMGLWKEGVDLQDAWSKLPLEGHSRRPCMPIGLMASERPGSTMAVEDGERADRNSR